jgi:hypothetical protein
MKTLNNFFILKATVVILSGLFIACDEDTVIPLSYNLRFPELPETWLEVLGKASWHIEWVDEDGVVKKSEIAAGGKASGIKIMMEWTTPVIAWPYWPEKGIRYGEIKPAGALFPLDASGSSVKLSWQGGVDAVFFWELAAANNEKRLPYNFNWPRFRALFSDEELPTEVSKDPWLADWKAIAVKTAASGFDRRRIVAQKRSSRAFTAPADGPWIGISPFMRAENWMTGETFMIKVTDQVDSYFSSTGVLHCSHNTWNWLRYDRNQYTPALSPNRYSRLKEANHEFP